MISVVIPAYNEENTIGRTLESLTKQKTQRQFEVIVVDNNSTDNTSKKANSFKDRLELRVIKEPEKGRGTARATGFNNAKGDIILSTDADTQVPPQWIDALVNTLEENINNVGATGITSFVDGTVISRVLMSNSLRIFIIIYKLIFGHYWLSGYNFAVKKDVYHKSGGFRVGLNAQEDTDLALRVANYGNIAFSPNSKVITSARRYDGGLLKGLYEYILSFINMYNKKESYLDDKR